MHTRTEERFLTCMIHDGSLESVPRIDKIWSMSVLFIYFDSLSYNPAVYRDCTLLGSSNPCQCSVGLLWCCVPNQERPCASQCLERLNPSTVSGLFVSEGFFPLLQLPCQSWTKEFELLRRECSFGATCVTPFSFWLLSSLLYLSLYICVRTLGAVCQQSHTYRSEDHTGCAGVEEQTHYFTCAGAKSWIPRYWFSLLYFLK